MGGNRTPLREQGTHHGGSATGNSEQDNSYQPSSHGLSRFKLHVSIIILLAAFSIGMLERNRIRAHYWALRLAHSNDLSAQGYYLALLTHLGPSARGAVQRLARDDHSNVRALAVYALQRLGDPVCVDELGHLLADDDEAVRESAATALAFMGASDATRTLIRAAQSEDGRQATAAACALSRLEPPAGLCVLCGLARHHGAAGVRAQAVEAIMDAIVSSDGRALSDAETQSAVEARESDCDPVRAMIDALDDGGRFTGPLCLERGRSGAARFAGAATSQSPPAERTVGEVAVSCLSNLMGRSIQASELLSPSQRQLWARQCRISIRERFQH